MAVTLLSPDGTVLGWPHWTTVPSLLRAMLKSAPAAIATTLLNPEGTEACPYALAPHATTVPSLLRAKHWLLEEGAAPTATATTLLNPSGTELLEPQRITVPSLLNASVLPSGVLLVATATTLLRPSGGETSLRGFEPHQTTVPSFFTAKLRSDPAAMLTT